MGEEKPRKRGRPKGSKNSNKSASLSAQPVKITVNHPQEIEKINNMIREALQEALLEKESKVLDKDIAIKAMVATCSEFMKSFIIMGYDMENNAINPVFYAKNDLEADALSHYAQQYFVQTMKDMK